MNEVVLDQSFVRNLTIPPRPEIVAVIFEEMSRDDPDLHRIAHEIACDVGLAAAMLKAANSPAFGLQRKLSSVAQAVEFLGMRYVAGIATGLSIRHALGGGNNKQCRVFWDTAEKTALLCATFARKLRGIAVDEAYTFGLFHDCGIPLLMERFPAYADTLVHAADDSEMRRMADVEQADVGTHHGAVGYFLTRSWQLPDDFCRAVLWHHDVEVFEDRNIAEPVRDFVGIVHLAEHVLSCVVERLPSAEWRNFGTQVMAHFGLNDDDMTMFYDTASDTLATV